VDERAAVGGDSRAMFRLAQMYYKGLGGPQDYQLAPQWYEKAAATGHRYAIYKLSLCCGGGWHLQLRTTSSGGDAYNIQRRKGMGSAWRDDRVLKEARSTTGPPNERGLTMSKRAAGALRDCRSISARFR
jgi:TPR repeat protein